MFCHRMVRRAGRKTNGVYPFAADGFCTAGVGDSLTVHAKAGDRTSYVHVYERKVE